ncbi:MAG TPA: hypothetical protein VNI20_06160 [Fimbriimonadaceae bacterium]|nr:hypothetical protein [Fimbriimonadaceae bacterium]
MEIRRARFFVPVLLLGLFGAGCWQGDTDLGNHKIDTKALDAYMGDAPDPVPQRASYAMTVSKTYDGIYGEWTATMDMKKMMAEEKAKMKAQVRAQAANSPNGNQQDADEFSEKFADAMAGALTQMMKADLTINKDGTFKMMFMYLPIEGTWTRKGDRLTLEAKTFMGMTSEEFKKHSKNKAETKNFGDKPMILQVGPDETWLKAVPDGGGDPDLMVFHRGE